MQEAPTEFRYFEHASLPFERRLRAAVRVLTGIELAPSDDTVRTFAAMYYDGDPLAEAFVDEVYLKRGMHAGRAMLDQALASGVRSVEGAPMSLVALFDDLEKDPPWVDRALVDRGAQVFRRYGPEMFRLAGAVTLEAYSESSVAKPLALSGAYAGETTKHRFMETVAFWIAVSEPGGLAPGAAGRAAAMRVRMMHVFVRRRLLQHPEWDRAAWGVPISQGDALLTLMGGSIVPGLALQLLGHRPSRADIEATLHFWRYVGHLVGVRPRWYPRDVAEALQVLYVARTKGVRRAGEDGKRLCQSYAAAFAPRKDDPLLVRARDALSHRAHLGFTRLFLSGPSYRHNGLPPVGPWMLLPLVPAPLTFAAETLRRRFPALDPVADRVARARRDRFFARHMRGAEVSFEPRARFTR
jgi:hypothetical protein